MKQKIIEFLPYRAITPIIPAAIPANPIATPVGIAAPASLEEEEDPRVPVAEAPIFPDSVITVDIRLDETSEEEEEEETNAELVPLPVVPLPPPTEEAVAVAVAVAGVVVVINAPVPAVDMVPVAFANAGIKYVCTAVGSAVNHAGVSPAANSEASWEETPAELVRASLMREEGRAVWRTETTERLCVLGVRDIVSLEFLFFFLFSFLFSCCVKWGGGREKKMGKELNEQFGSVR